jgi:phosphoribosylaminoimidazole-succinocarboxamide synthase
MPNRLHQGKVRDTYQLTDDLLLMVATDRISAFDVVLPNGIPDKGAVLNRMSAFWFEQTGHIVPNHLIVWPTPRMPANTPTIRSSRILRILKTTWPGRRWW